MTAGAETVATRIALGLDGRRFESILCSTRPSSSEEVAAVRAGGVFLPHAPNPTSGFLLFYPQESLIPTTLKVEQALKMVVSGGVVSPAAD